MRRMSWIVVVALVCAAQAGQVVKRPPVAVKIKPVDPADARLAAALNEKKVSFDFVDTPLQDAVAFLRQLLEVNVVLDPKVDGGKALTLRVNDMPAGSAIRWMAKVSGAEMKIENGAVFLAAVPKAKRPPVQGYPPYRYRPAVGRAQIKLGDAASVDLQLYDDDIDPDTRKMLLKLLHRALEKELAKLEKQK